MAGTYLMHWTNSAVKSPFQVQPNSQDITTTTLVITGRGRFNWGQQLQENLLHLMEHFADYNPPANPTAGQVYYNYNTKQLYLYDGTKWVPLGGQVYWADASEYNQFATIINSIYTTPYPYGSDSRGYNQVAIPQVVGRHAVASDWAIMTNALQNICGHQGTTFDTQLLNLDFLYQSENPGFVGLWALSNKYTALAAMANLVVTNCNNINTSTRESFSDSTTTRVRTTAWTGTITQEILFTYPDINSARAYWNTQGQIKFNFSLSNPVDSHDVVWANQLSSIGTLLFQRHATSNSAGVTGSPVGYYDLTTSYQRIYSWTSAAMAFTVDVRSEGSGTQIRFLVTFTDNSGSAYGGSVEGTLKSQATLVKVAPIYMNNPEIPYPTATQAGSM
ncbi:hypothetical protein RsoM2USA_355 [Ralstonia phage RsoM2USA]|nr:hypothetical protein RsoM2USA_355 [Ralstonia phage RsoM2USA]